MQKQSEMVRLLGISGSLRENAFSTSILHSIAENLDQACRMSVFTLEGIPLYNQDFDVIPALARVAELRAAVEACDGVVVATSEYNHGIPGVLKNALDWASRPAFQSCFRQKPVLIVSSSTASTGGVRAQYQLRETLVSMQARVVSTREVVIGNVGQKIIEGSFADEGTMSFILEAIGELGKEITSRRSVLAS